jgi:hypothetical protein
MGTLREPGASLDAQGRGRRRKRLSDDGERPTASILSQDEKTSVVELEAVFHKSP